jgi:probable rRNA maturation factor
MTAIYCKNIEEPSFMPRLQAFCREAALLCHITENEILSLTLTDNVEIRSLNRLYRDKDKATDVLSFCMDDKEEAWPETDDDESPKELGDIIISVEMVKENAQYFKVTEEEELKRLIIHGMLHLTGKDHATNNSDEPMLCEQEAILGKLKHIRLQEGREELF